MSPSSCPSPSKKLLITVPKPKSGSNSDSSSSATSKPLPEKRTRDQPNLSDCHCCGSRIVHTNPKDRLQPLYSVWRIVLLCRKCRRSICSGQTCPYCFKATANSGDLCTCKVCQRKIHDDCIKDYGKCTPWRYLGEGFGEGFRVCVDCWVPEVLKNSFQVLVRSENRGGLKDMDEGKDYGNREAERKTKNAGKAKEQVPRRSKGASDEGDLVDGAFGFPAKNDKDSMKSGNSYCSGETEFTDDAELAIQLHRVINSSPRILRVNKPLRNSNDREASNIGNWKGLSYKRSGLGKRCSEDQKLVIYANSDVNGRRKENDTTNGVSELSQGLIPYRRDRKRKIWSLNHENTEISELTSSQQAILKNLHSDEAGDKCLDEDGVWCSYEAAVGCSLKTGADTSDHSIRADIGRSNSCIDGGRLGNKLIRYKRTRYRNRLVGISGDSSSCGNPEVGQPDRANLNTSFEVKSDSEEILLSGSSDIDRDRFHLKYVKRISGTKTDSSFQHCGTFLNENQVSAPAVKHSDAGFPVNDCEFTLPNEACAHAKDRYSFKYAKRVKSSNSSSNLVAKLHSDAFLDKNGESATGLTTNCSAESRTLSDDSFESSTVDLPQ